MFYIYVRYRHNERFAYRYEYVHFTHIRMLGYVTLTVFDNEVIILEVSWVGNIPSFLLFSDRFWHGVVILSVTFKGQIRYV